MGNHFSTNDVHFSVVLEHTTHTSNNQTQRRDCTEPVVSLTVRKSEIPVMARRHVLVLSPLISMSHDQAPSPTKRL